jgi:uncharacterized protein (TIGR02646 family)
MIQIHKRKEVPKVLVERGAKLKQKMIEDFSQGRPIPRIDQKVFGHPTVKEALKEDQHFKCCYCEESFEHVAFGDVEHFRPKGGAKQTEDDKSDHVGYFWLAYDWENLFYCCQRCNSSFKKTYFPLEVPGNRAKSPLDPLEDEMPLILAPTEDPSAHIMFDKFDIKAKDGSRKGEETIKRTGLDRVFLSDERRKYYEQIANFGRVIELCEGHSKLMPASSAREFQKLASEARERIQHAMQPTERFSGMIRDNFGQF